MALALEKRLRKIPKTVLVINKLKPAGEACDLSLESTKVYFCECSTGRTCGVCRKNKGTQYELVFLCDYVFSFDSISPLNICEAEIIFNRKPFDEEMFLEGIEHFSNCEIRNGK